MKYDLPLLLIHYSIPGTDDCPLKNSFSVIDFIHAHHIENIFCGHTRKLELMQTADLYIGNSERYPLNTLHNRLAIECIEIASHSGCDC